MILKGGFRSFIVFNVFFRVLKVLVFSGFARVIFLWFSECDMVFKSVFTFSKGVFAVFKGLLGFSRTFSLFQ